MKRPTTKLSISRETVRKLSAADLSAAHSGAIGPTYNLTCDAGCTAPPTQETPAGCAGGGGSMNCGGGSDVCGTEETL